MISRMQEEQKALVSMWPHPYPHISKRRHSLQRAMPHPSQTPGRRDKRPAGRLFRAGSPFFVKYLDEYRDAGFAQQLAREIHRVVTQPWTIMEVCGGQTHAIVKFGIDELLPKQITLIHGPGCPVLAET